MSLSTNNLKIYRNHKLLCENINLHLLPGKILGILGPNGCGKTTLLQTLAGLLPYQGEIYLNQQLLSSSPSKTRAKHIGILFQHSTSFFSDTVFEFCSQGRYPHNHYFSYLDPIDQKIIHDILSVMDLLEMKNKKVDSLSGGEKKRLEIATLLVQDPQIFLLDEPTNHVDLYYQIKIAKYFQHLQSHKIIVIATHDIFFAEQYCDEILMLFRNGEHLFGTKSEVLTAENLSLLYQHPMIKLHPRGFLPLY